MQIAILLEIHAATFSRAIRGISISTSTIRWIQKNMVSMVGVLYDISYILGGWTK